jgi:hypothetical protein
LEPQQKGTSSLVDYETEGTGSKGATVLVYKSTVAFRVLGN